jgi:predicted transcriptional regulator
MTSQMSLQQLQINIHKENADFAQIVSQIEDHCHNCKPLSPMSCIEQCEIWKMKNEFLKIGEILGQGNHLSELFNVIKNVRRLKILDIVSALPCDIKELQKRLKDNGYYHSCRTISEYLEPLLKIGLVKKEGNRYRSTLYGREINAMLKRFNLENALPKHSSCYEETVLRELLHGPKAYEELVKSGPSLSRVIRRLQEEGLIIKKKSVDHVSYFQIKRNFDGKFSPTERRVLDAISEAGVPARKLSKRVGINLRRTYKYLRRLANKGLVFTKSIPRTYELTRSGKEVARFLDELARFISTASNFSALDKRNHNWF